MRQEQLAATKKRKGGSKPRKREQYREEPQGEIGPDTPAQREGAQIIRFRQGGSLIQRKFRNHLVTRMQRRGKLSRREAAAALELLDRWEATWRSPPPAWTRDHVDASPRPGDVDVASLEAKAHYHELSQWISRANRWIVQAVVFHQRPVRPALTNNHEKARQLEAALGEELRRLAAVLRI